MTFEEWWEKWQKDTQAVFFSYERSFAKEAWDTQQDKIDALTIDNNAYEKRESAYIAQIEEMEAALRSIAENTCRDRCQEVSVVARQALGIAK